MNVPALRFPEFSTDKKVPKNSRLKFEDIFNFSGGKNIKQAEASPEFTIPCVRYGELYHMYQEVILEVINRTNLPTEDLHFSDGDEILLPSAGEDPWDIGAASALTISGVAIGRTINILKPKNADTVSHIFAAYYINAALRTTIATLARGSSISNVYNSDLKKLTICLPSLPEQKKIAAFLGVVDAKIAALRVRQTGLERYKRGLMQALFSQTLRFTKPDGSAFPDWEEKRLGDVFSFFKGKGISKADIADEGKTPCIRYGELYTKYAEVIDNVVSQTDVPLRELILSKTDDVIIPASGEDRLDMARASCVLKSGIALGGDLNILRGAKNGVFLAYYLTNAKKKEIARFAQGNSVVHLYGTQLKIMTVSLPHPEEQQKIADALSAMDAKIAAVAGQVAQMEAFKKGLLQQMFV